MPLLLFFGIIYFCNLVYIIPTAEILIGNIPSLQSILCGLRHFGVRIVSQLGNIGNRTVTQIF